MVEWYFLKFQYYSPGGAIYDAKGNRVGFLSPYDATNPWSKLYLVKPAKVTIPFELDENGIPIPIVEEEPEPEPEPEPEKATSLESTPTGAKVYVNGKLAGNTNISLIDLKAEDEIKLELEGYETMVFNIREESIGTTLSLKLEPISVPKTWWQKIYEAITDLTKFTTILFSSEGVEAMWELWKIADEKTNWIPPDRKEEFVILKFPIWFAMPEAEIFAAVGKAGLVGEPAAKLVLALKHQNYIKSLEWMKAHPVQAVKDFPKLGPNFQAELLKGLSKDRLAVPFIKELEAASLQHLKLLDTSVFTKLTAALRDPKTLNYSIGRIAGLLAAAAGTQFGLEWAVKEGIIEPLVFPYTQELSAYRFEPTPERRELIESMLKRMEGKIPMATSIMEGLGWIFPPLKPLWDEIAATYDRQLIDFRKELEIIEEPEAVGILAVTSNIEDSAVYIDGVWVGKTPYEKEMETKTYHILVTKGGYTSDEKDIEVMKDMSVGFPAKIELLEETASISVVSSPETGADVYIDENLKPFKTNTTFTGLELGIHKVRIFKAPFHRTVYDVKPEEIEIELTEVGQTKEAKFSLTARELPAETGNISITSSPTGASIWINDELQTFKTNTVIEDYPIGPIEIKIHKDGYEDPAPVSETLESAEVQAVDFGTLKLLPEVPGRLIIDVSPGDVDVYEAGVLKFHIDSSGHYEELLQPASFSYVFKKENYRDEVKKFFIESEVDEPLAFTLTEIPPNIGYVVVQTSPGDVDVSTALGLWGTTDSGGAASFEVIPGYYMISFSKAGYKTRTATVYVNRGEESPLDITLIAEEVEEEYYTPATEEEVAKRELVEVAPGEYAWLYPATGALDYLPLISAPVEKEIMINVETTGVYPWESRLYSIAYLDLTTPGAEIQIFVDNDEKKLLQEFMAEFEPGNYVKLLGFNVGFDHRFIFNKLMLHRMQSKKFKEIKMRDVKQLMDQVQEAFVYNAKKKGTLDDYSKELLGRGKFGKQEVMLKKYLAGDFGYVAAFQTRQIELTRDLYDLFRFSAIEGREIASAPIPAAETAISVPEPIQTPALTGKKTCPNCKAYQPITASVCEICGFKI